ncbi:MAG: FtsW/RodA/SpoVE family cell cycle protein [Planctomycetota bacterium]
MGRVQDKLSQIRRRISWLGLFSTLALVALGLVFIYSTTHHRPAYRGSLKIHLFYVILSIPMLVVLLAINYKWFQRYAFLIFLAGIVLVLLTHVPGVRVQRNYSYRWIGSGRFSIQPSEIMKIAFVVGLARYLMYRRNYRQFVGLAVPFIISFAPMILILKQPDLGTSLVFLPVLFAMLYAAGAKTKHLAIIVLLGLLSVPVMWTSVMKPGQKQRIMSYLDAEAALEAGQDHAVKAQEAISRGGMTGEGLTHSIYNERGLLYAAESDFIFAIVCGEWGFVGAQVILILYTLLVVSIVQIALTTREPFGRLIVIGLGTLIVFQALTNMAIASGLLPTTGLTLPFISKGGSSLLSMVAAMGIILNVGINQEPILAREDFNFGPGE